MTKDQIQKLKKFLKDFDSASTEVDISEFPEGFGQYVKDPNEFNDILEALSREERSKFNFATVAWDLNEPEKPALRSRTWGSAEGYRYLLPWSNATLLRYLIRAYTFRLPKSEYRRKAQVDDAGRSVVRNIEEGYKRSTTLEYLQFLGYSQGSLEEVKGDIRELTEDGFLKSRPGSSLADLGIDLKAFSDALKREHGRYYRENKGNYGNLEENKGGQGNLEENKGGQNLEENKGNYGKLGEVKGDKGNYGNLEDIKGAKSPGAFRKLSEIHPPLKKVKTEDLSYEVFLELINKTDFLLQKLAKSLEEKLAREGKHYQVEQARLKSKTFWKLNRKE